MITIIARPADRLTSSVPPKTVAGATCYGVGTRYIFSAHCYVAGNCVGIEECR